MNAKAVRPYYVRPYRFLFSLWLPFYSSTAACAAASLAIGTLNGEQDT